MEPDRAASVARRNRRGDCLYRQQRGTHVFAGFGGDYDFNQATVDGFGTLTTNQRKPYFTKFGWSQNFRYYGSDANSNYHGMQLKAEKRFSRGYSLLGHYTWSRAFNYTNTYYNIDQDLAYGPNDNHRKHVFGLHGVWELPFGSGRRYMQDAGAALDAILGGWQLNTVYTWQSGLPFTPSYRDCNADRDTGLVPSRSGGRVETGRADRGGVVRHHAAGGGRTRDAVDVERPDARSVGPPGARHVLATSDATGSWGRRSRSSTCRSSRTSC